MLWRNRSQSKAGPRELEEVIAAARFEDYSSMTILTGAVHINEKGILV